MSWKTFKFFDFEDAKDPETNQPFSKLKDLGITCCSCGRGMMVFGDGDGYIHILHSLNAMFSYQAFVLRVQHLYQLKTRNIIITVGDDEDFTPLIRVWNLDKRDKQGTPVCCHSMRAAVFSGGVETSNSAVMCICAHENLNLIAVGFKNGTAIVLKGNITRDRQSRQRVVHQENVEGVYITGMAFRNVGVNPVLMIATNNAVYSCYLGDQYVKNEVGVVGCEFNCCALSDHSQDFKFVIGRTEAVHFFTTEGPAQCKAFEGDKSLIRWCRGYLLVVCEPAKGGGRAGPFGGHRTLSIYDIQNQFVAYQGRFENPVADILSEWGSLYVLLKNGRLVKLDELDTKTKLETLFKKNLYHTAISLARSQSYSDGLVEIFTQYGDHLYSKGDFDGAIAQYKLTIGTLEPSYVIRKFLDAQRILNLTDYLKELHDKGEANADHTTLLLNCYTKLKNVNELTMFVKEEKFSFDVEAAIKVCRQSTYFDHALALAHRFKEHDWYFLIVLEDVHRPEEALKYVKTLNFKAAETNMVKYGRSIFQALPDETTDLLITLCIDWPIHSEAPPAPSPTGAISGPDVKLRSNPGTFIPVFVDNKDYLMTFLEKMTELRMCWTTDVCNTLLELYLSGSVRSDKNEREKKALQLLMNVEAKYDVDHALMLARTCDFKEGILYLYERTALYQQILAYHMEHNDVAQVMNTCKRFSQREPTLWVQALTYFASQESCKSKIKEVLQYIEELHLLQPLMVVQLLAQYKYATLGDIEPYLRRHLEAQNSTIEKDEKLVREYRDSTLRTREKIAEIQGKAKVFQVMKCSGCQRSLNLPAVHFLCQHSFHQSTCLEDEYENECPICARENRKLLDIIQRQERSDDLDELFHAQLNRSADGFSVVADYFGRGVFSKVKKNPDRGH